MTLSETAKPRLAAKTRLKWDEVRQKHLLLYPEGVLVLNPTAHAILALCEGERTVGEIIRTLTEQYGSDVVAVDVHELLRRLADKGLVTFAANDTV